MLGKFSRGFKILKACWRVLMLDKELLMFPLMSVIVLIFLGTVAGAPFFTNPEFPANLERWFAAEGELSDWTLYGVGFLIYLVTYFVVIFFNAALIAAATIRFNGGNPGLADGLSVAIKRLPQILVWACVAATVGFLLNQLENQSKGLARFVVGLLGLGWSIASYFAVPMLVIDGVSPLAAVKGSVDTIKKSWGESLVATIGLGIFYGVISMVGVASIFIGIIVIDFSLNAGVAIISLAVTFLLLCVLVFSTLSSILKTALFVFARDGVVPDGFDRDMVAGAFKAP